MNYDYAASIYTTVSMYIIYIYIYKYNKYGQMKYSRSTNTSNITS